MEQVSQPVVAVVNTSIEVLDLLQEIFTEEGFSVTPAFTLEFKRGERDFRAFVAEHKPRAILWDIALPYAENWEYFRNHVLGLGIMPARCFICTTVNKAVLESLVGPTTTIELIGRPFDLEVIVDAVRRAVSDPRRE